MSVTESTPDAQPAHTPTMTTHPVKRRKKLIEVAIPSLAYSTQMKHTRCDQKTLGLIAQVPS
jgi:hypothetical protein